MNPFKHSTREPERGARDKVCRAGERALSDGSPKTLQHWRQVIHTVRAGLPNHEAFFEHTMETFHHSVQLWMIHCSGGSRDAESDHKMSPKSGDKLASLI